MQTTQLNITFSLTDAGTFMQWLEACIRNIIWMIKNRLKQNGEKTEVLYTYKAGFSSKQSLRPLQIGGIYIFPAENVKSLEVTLDSSLTLNKHVSAVCSAASLHIRNIGKIRRLLTQSITEKLVHAFITARLDYCNSIPARPPQEAYSAFTAYSEHRSTPGDTHQSRWSHNTSA